MNHGGKIEDFCQIVVFRQRETLQLHNNNLLNTYYILDTEVKDTIIGEAMNFSTRM